MFLLWRRYSRSRAAPPWFYVVFALAFAAVAVWGVIAGNWLVVGLGVVMVAVSLSAMQLARLIARSAQSGARQEGEP